ncbi:hypothetical protein SLEP1_g29475 [Rubroshorea leprosula]|uniref:HAT C-terminal dimerisation domain-containing protein n=1 Tax=Rubroshorea leprosula TaxID=152421 RepID=A0AAV5K351_9ROSI|nr:hypothetical protein SLEP1_g29475 [Rubroshorea leprosula]
MKDGKFVEKVVLDPNFWKNITTCLKAANPLIKVLRLVDSDEKPAMPFIYEEVDRCKEKIQENFKKVKKSYEPIWKIIDDRWASQLHRPLHAAAYFLNAHLRFDPNPENNYKVDMEVKRGFYDCLERMVLNQDERNKIDSQIDFFKARKGLFGSTQARNMWNKKSPADWWESYGDEYPELQRFAIRILSLTCSSSGCERNWSAFEMVHTKRRNRLHQKKMNDLVFVMCNLKLKDKQVRKKVELDDVSSDDEWLADFQTNEELIDPESEDDMEDDFVEDGNEDELENHDSLETTFFNDEDDEENQDIEAEENDDMEDDF